MVAERTRQYELVMILSPESTEQEAAGTVENVHGLITGGGGTVGEHEMWGLRRLAYPLRNFREGNYVLTNFESSPTAIEGLEDNLKASQEIMRFLVTRK